MSRFMETQVTKRIWWVTLDKHGESVTIPQADYSPSDHDGYTRDGCDFKGYGVRESAPGYLDCTEWEVFDTLKEAEARADEIDAEYEEEEE